MSIPQSVCGRTDLENDLNDFNPFFKRNDDFAFSNFGAGNPIQELVEDTGLPLNYDLIDNLGVSLGYF